MKKAILFVAYIVYLIYIRRGIFIERYLKELFETVFGEIMGSENDKDSEKGLTTKEALFLKHYFSGLSETEAYLRINPDVTRPSAGSNASRLLRDIKKKCNWSSLLDEAGLGEPRLLQELLRHLRMKKLVYYLGTRVDECEDSTVQLRATELLADFLGKRKTQFELFGPDGGPMVVQYEIVKPKKEKE